MILPLALLPGNCCDVCFCSCAGGHYSITVPCKKASYWYFSYGNSALCL